MDGDFTVNGEPVLALDLAFEPEITDKLTILQWQGADPPVTKSWSFIGGSSTWNPTVKYYGMDGSDGGYLKLEFLPKGFVFIVK